MAPIIARTVATFNAAKRYGSAFGIRTRRKISISPAAYERISSIDDGRTRRQPAQRVHEHREEAEHRRDHHLRERVQEPEPVVRDRGEGDDRDRVRGDHVRHQRRAERPPAREHERRQRSRALQPITKPPSASLNVNQPALQSVSQSSQSVCRISESGGSRKRSTSRPARAALPERDPEREDDHAPGAHSLSQRASQALLRRDQLLLEALVALDQAAAEPQLAADVADQLRVARLLARGERARLRQVDRRSRRRSGRAAATSRRPGSRGRRPRRSSA